MNICMCRNMDGGVTAVCPDFQGTEVAAPDEGAAFTRCLAKVKAAAASLKEQGHLLPAEPSAFLEELWTERCFGKQANYTKRSFTEKEMNEVANVSG